MIQTTYSARNWISKKSKEKTLKKISLNSWITQYLPIQYKTSENIDK